jgi:hypothetical protein
VMALFMPLRFLGHSGNVLSGRIECDALTWDDWMGIIMLCQGAGLFPEAVSEVVAVPRGGTRFAIAVDGYADLTRSVAAPRLVVDDVLTTGTSMRDAMDRPDDIGLVVFARGPLIPRVSALFTMAQRAA